MLLSRDEFRTGVFSRDNHKCVACGARGQDAHHIIERRLWVDGGYYLDNGATVCGPCHLEAESTRLSCDKLRAFAGITRNLYPPHFDTDFAYDKWGNMILPSGERSAGELYYDESVQKVLDKNVVFSKRFKFPKIPHHEMSQGKNSDDLTYTGDEYRHMSLLTEKMDGENTSIYWDGYCHARSILSCYHQSRTWVKNLAGRLSADLPDGWRVCGENLYAKHSIKYDNLESWFLVFAIFDHTNMCLSWGETKLWCDLLDLKTVPVIETGAVNVFDRNVSEGRVMRNPDSFHYSQVRHNMCKFVRPNHVQTHGHWMNDTIEKNGVM